MDFKVTHPLMINSKYLREVTLIEYDFDDELLE